MGPEDVMRRAIQMAVVAMLLVLLYFGVAEWHSRQAGEALDPVGNTGIQSPTGDKGSSEDPSDLVELAPEENHLDTCELEKNPSRITSTTFWIDVDISEQKVRIMEGENVVHREMIASTGVEGHETPLGTFEIQNRGEWFFNEKYKQGAKYWVSFKDWGIYLFHSVAMDKNQKIIPEEAAKLGTPASHGCIRLKVEDAKWIYDYIPERTKVVIHE